jgi:hypothetical protein
VFRAQVGVALKLVPGIVERKLRHLVDLISPFKQSARGLVPQVMEMEVINPEDVTGTRERGPDTIRVKGEDELLALCLVLHDFPGLGRILETPVIAFLGRRVLRIAHQPRPMLGIVVSPFEPADFRLPSRRMQRKLHDFEHGYLGSWIAPREELPQLLQLLGARAAGPLLRLGDQA